MTIQTSSLHLRNIWFFQCFVTHPCLIRSHCKSTLTENSLSTGAKLASTHRTHSNRNWRSIKTTTRGQTVQGRGHDIAVAERDQGHVFGLKAVSAMVPVKVRDHGNAQDHRQYRQRGVYFSFPHFAVLYMCYNWHLVMSLVVVTCFGRPISVTSEDRIELKGLIRVHFRWHLWVLPVFCHSSFNQLIFKRLLQWSNLMVVLFCSIFDFVSFF